MIIYDKEKIVEWLTEISLLPYDFSRPEDYDENMTEDLADGALELLKEQEPVVPLTIDDAVSELMDKHYKRLKRQETVGL